MWTVSIWLWPMAKPLYVRFPPCISLWGSVKSYIFCSLLLRLNSHFWEEQVHSPATKELCIFDCIDRATHLVLRLPTICCYTWLYHLFIIIWLLCTMETIFALQVGTRWYPLAVVVKTYYDIHISVCSFDLCSQEQILTFRYSLHSFVYHARMQF